MNLIVALGVILLGGMMSGLFTAPLKYLRGAWKWENAWLTYCVYGLLLFPWIVVTFTVPDVFGVYSAAKPEAVALALVFGALWGCGSVLFGAGCDIVGNSLGFAIILGLTSAMGSALPLLILHFGDAGSQEGIATWVGLVIVIAGLVTLGKAGILREQDQAEGASKDKMPTLMVNETSSLLKPQVEEPAKASFRTGLFICLLSGVLSPALNLALDFGSDVQDKAEDQGASSVNASNATWALAVSAGFIPNLIFTSYKLTKNGTWSAFGDLENGLVNILLGASMGAMWFGGTVMYGIGAAAIGDLGSVLGWPVFMCAMVMTANINAYLTGEWAGTSRKAKRMLVLGLLILLVAITVISLGGVHL